MIKLSFMPRCFMHVPRYQQRPKCPSQFRITYFRNVIPVDQNVIVLTSVLNCTPKVFIKLNALSMKDAPSVK